MKELICIGCPKGCHLKVDENNDYAVVGASCEKGVVYGKTELKDPRRTVTSTVKICGSALPRLPVKTSAPVPKAKVFDVARALDGVCVTAPVRLGDVIVSNVCQTGADIVATRSLFSV